MNKYGETAMLGENVLCVEGKDGRDRGLFWCWGIQREMRKNQEKENKYTKPTHCLY